MKVTESKGVITVTTDDAPTNTPPAPPKSSETPKPPKTEVDPHATQPSPFPRGQQSKAEAIRAAEEEAKRIG